MSPILCLCFLLLSSSVHLSSQVSICQWTPKNNLPVCANTTLEYYCHSSTGILLVQSDDDNHLFSTSSSLNEPVVIGSFSVKLVSVDGKLLTVTATSIFTNSSYQGKRILVYDDKTFFAKDVTVAAGPDACQGIITCSVTPVPDSHFSELTVSLNPTQDGSRCITNYNFVLGNDSLLTSTDPAVATFCFDRSHGQPYLNQKIYPLDGEGRQGEYPCLFSITAPNPVTMSHKYETCNGSITMVTIIFDVPTFPPENCLDIHDVKLNYHITASNGVLHEPIDTLNNCVDMLVDQKTEFELSITPTLPDLGISGAPYTTTIDVSASCQVDSIRIEKPTSAVAVVLGCLFVFTLLFLAATWIRLLLPYICPKKIHGRCSYWRPRCQNESKRESEGNFPVKVQYASQSEREDANFPSGDGKMKESV